MAKITVLGSGGWGTALTISAFNCGHEVSLWSPFEQEVYSLNQYRENIKLLPNIKIPDEITITSDISCAKNSLISIIACPSVAVRSVSKQLASVENHGIVVNVAKGLDASFFTSMRYSILTRSSSNLCWSLSKMERLR